MENKAADEIQQQYIKRISGNVCGPHLARLLYYRNTHPNRSIKIVIDHHWEYNGEEHHKREDYVLDPNPDGPFDRPNALDVLMGCPVPGPTQQKFHWDVLSAQWA
jgi:hypothetical protein